MTQAPVGSRSRYGFIDAIRGIAACSVLLQHSLYQSGLLGTGNKLTSFVPSWLELGETGVVAFFLVSGFVIPLSLEKTSDFRLFWIHRALRIYPLYLFIFVSTLILRNGGTLDSFRAFIVNISSHMLFIQEYVRQEEFVGGSWTLSLEAVWYVSISCLFLVSLHKKTDLIVVVGVLVSVASQALCASGHHLPMGRLSMLLCCVVGLICYRRSREEISLSRFRLLIMIVCGTIVSNLLFGLLLYPSEKPTASFRMAIVSWTLAYAIFLIPFITRRSTIWAHSGFAFLGRVSYSVYLLHPVVLYCLSKTTLNGLSLVVAAFSVTIPLSIVTYSLIELPPIRFGHTLRPNKIQDFQPVSAVR